MTARSFASASGDFCVVTQTGKSVAKPPTEKTPSARPRSSIQDLVVLDFLMPHNDGIDAAREIGKRSPGTPILLCTICLTPQLVDLARGAGVSGTLPKGELNKVVTCCETLLRGEPFFFCNNRLERGQHIPGSI